MVLASTSGLMVEWDSQNTCHKCFCHQRESQLSLQEPLKDQQASGSDRLLSNYCLCTGRLRVYEILSASFKGKVSVYYSPTSFPHARPPGFQSQTSWGFIVLVHNLWVAVLMWGLGPSLLGENLCNCDWLSSSLWVMDQGYGSRLDWDSAPPTYLSVVPSSYILLQRIFSTISFQAILIGSCSANCCNFF